MTVCPAVLSVRGDDDITDWPCEWRRPWWAFWRKHPACHSSSWVTWTNHPAGRQR